MSQELLIILLSISNVRDSINCGPISCFDVGCHNCPLNMIGFDYIEPIEIVINESRITNDTSRDK